MKVKKVVFQMDNKHIDALEDFMDSLLDNKEALQAQFQNWNPNKDARMTIFNKCVHVCSSTYLSFNFIYFELRDSRWLNKIYVPKLSQDEGNQLVGEYKVQVKMAFVQFVFSAIESALRTYVRVLDPTACNNGTAEFKNIYSYLLRRLNLQTHENFLDLLRLIRNTIHNNGVYFHKSNRNEEIVYKGNNYKFDIGVRIDFVTWDFIFELMQDVEKLILDIVKSNEISQIPEIIDPVA